MSSSNGMSQALELLQQELPFEMNREGDRRTLSIWTLAIEALLLQALARGQTKTLEECVTNCVPADGTGSVGANSSGEDGYRLANRVHAIQTSKETGCFYATYCGLGVVASTLLIRIVGIDPNDIPLSLLQMSGFLVPPLHTAFRLIRPELSQSVVLAPVYNITLNLSCLPEKLRNRPVDDVWGIVERHVLQGTYILRDPFVFLEGRDSTENMRKVRIEDHLEKGPLETWRNPSKNLPSDPSEHASLVKNISELIESLNKAIHAATNRGLITEADKLRAASTSLHDIDKMAADLLALNDRRTFARNLLNVVKGLLNTIKTADADTYKDDVNSMIIIIDDSRRKILELHHF
jgi:hypothetical protein